MTMHKALHTWDGIDKKKKKKKKGEWGLSDIKDCLDAALGPEKYTKKSKDRLIAAASNSNSSRND